MDLENQIIQCPFTVGSNYFIRTVTYFATGKVKDIVGHFLILENAACVFDTGGFTKAITKGTLEEVEPVNVDMYLNLEAIVDAFPWMHPLPK